MAHPRTYVPRSEAAVDGRVERADDEEGEEEVEGARDEVVVGKVGLVVVDVDLAEVAVLEVRQRLEPRRQEDGADEGRADGRQQHRDPEGLGGERETSETVLEVAMTSEAVLEVAMTSEAVLEASMTSEAVVVVY